MGQYEFIPPRGFTATGSEPTSAEPSIPFAKKSPSGTSIEGNGLSS